MAEHTPTPWTAETTEDLRAKSGELGVDLTTDWREFGQNGLCLGAAYMKDSAENEANSARLVACVNAFHSDTGRELATEKIEPGLFWEMRDLLESITRAELPERDNLAWRELVQNLMKAPARALLAKLEDTGQ